jgi:hypothetical protein
MMFENGVLRRNVRPKRKRVRAGWKLHIEDFYNLCSSLNIVNEEGYDGQGM